MARQQTDVVEALYATDAGIEAVLADLQQGKDPLRPDYVVPAPALNDYQATVTVQPAQAFPPLLEPYRYLDPGASTSLKRLETGEHWTFVFRAAFGDGIIVQWSFTPKAGSWELTLYQGEGTQGPLLAQASGTGSPGRLEVSPSLVTGGVYTVDFHNTHQGALGSDSYSDTGGDGRTWLRVRAFADYVIVSETDRATLRSYARHFPGPAFPQERQVVVVQTWEEGSIQE